MTHPRLRAATLETWIHTHLDSHLRAYDPDVDEATRRWLTLADILANEGAHLRASHAQIMDEDGATPAAAAKWAAGWYAGRLAHTAGYIYAFAAAAVIIDPDQVRFGRHPDGWSQLIDLGTPIVVVRRGHPWSGQRRVWVVDTEKEVAAIGLNSLRTAVEPILEATRLLAKVGRASLWAEVVDEFALACLAQEAKSEDLAESGPELIDRVLAAAHSPSLPWRRFPGLWMARLGDKERLIGRKGGCCLAYTCAPERAIPDEDLDEQTRAWEHQFPRPQTGRDYCNTCSLLSRNSCQDRQLFSSF